MRARRERRTRAAPVLSSVYSHHPCPACCRSAGCAAPSSPWHRQPADDAWTRTTRRISREAHTEEKATIYRTVRLGEAEASAMVFNCKTVCRTIRGLDELEEAAGAVRRRRHAHAVAAACAPGGPRDVCSGCVRSRACRWALSAAQDLAKQQEQLGQGLYAAAAAEAWMLTRP